MNISFNKTSFLVFCFTCQSLFASAQQNAIVKYYDSLWHEISKDSAIYLTRIIKEDTIYRNTSYWIDSSILNSKASYTNSSFSKRIGLFQQYYRNGQTCDSMYYIRPNELSYSYHFFENGQLSDSISYRDKNEKETAFHYYQNGNLWIHYYHSKEKNTPVTEAFDESGKKIDNFIYEREAVFPGGNSEWMGFLQYKLKPKVPLKNGAPKGKYMVIVRFVVSKDGTLTNIYTETHLGYGMEEEAIRVIGKSKKWIPAIQLGKPVNAYRRQPITFVVEQN